jgi:threonine/homoserine/homoserine lactone efflux protein
MIDPAKLAAFAIMSGATSVVPGPSMLFVMGQSIWRGSRSGAAALVGVQFGYVWWWFLAAVGLGTIAVTFPLFFHMLAILGAVYLVWLGISAFRSSREPGVAQTRPKKLSSHAFRDGILVAMSNPKSLIYIVALLPPFVDSRSAVVPQLVVLAIVAMLIDIALGAAYILAGNGLAKAMNRERTRVWMNRGVGAIFLLIAIAILADLLLA